MHPRQKRSNDLSTRNCNILRKQAMLSLDAGLQDIFALYTNGTNEYVASFDKVFLYASNGTLFAKLTTTGSTLLKRK